MNHDSLPPSIAPRDQLLAEEQAFLFAGIPGSAPQPVSGAPRMPATVISRPRLTDCIRPTTPLTVVRAPGGAGKTVLLAEWCKAADGDAAPGVWFTADEATADRLSFWSAVITTLHDAGLVRPGAALGTMIPALAATDDLRRLLQRGLRQLPDGLILVIDSFEFVTDPEVHDDLVWLLGHVPNLAVVVATRTVSALESASVRVRLDVNVVPPEELLFTVDEISAVLGSEGLDPSLAEEVHRSVGALPLMVRAVALALSRDGAEANKADLSEYLDSAGTDIVRELILDVDGGTGRFLDFLMRTSLADAVNVQLAERMADPTHARELLLAAENSGLGVRSKGEDGTLRLTPLVREALQRELRCRLPREVESLTRILIEWKQERGEYLGAFALSVGLGDYALASRVAQQDYLNLLEKHHLRVRELIGELSLLTLRRYPLLALLLALIYNAQKTHRVRALELFGVAVLGTRLHAKTASAEERALFSGLESVALRISGRVTGSRRAAETFLDTLDQLTPDERERMARILPPLMDQVGITILYLGDVDRALELFRASYSLPPQQQQPALHALSLIAGGLAIQGEILQVRQVLESARGADWPDGWRDGYRGALYHVAEALLALEEFDSRRAIEHVTVMDPHIETIEHWAFFAHARAIAELGLGNAVEAESQLRLLMQRGVRPATTPLTQTQLSITRSVLLLASGRAGEAAGALKRLPETFPRVAIARARVHLVTDKPEEAIAVLSALSLDALPPRLVTESQLIIAAAAHRRGQTELALDALRQATSTMMDCGLRQPLMLIPASDRRALAELSGTGSDAATLLLDPRVPDVLPAQAEKVTLTKREHLVLTSLVEHPGATEIAEQLFVSVNTVKSQLRSIYRKLDVNSREDALARATELGLVGR
ncbi:LuxR C-terminal-related transcriptional regulator [Homoserinimonas sp. OAct 916]|uniref:LuxR C-terminal-related transcriptional regulator n=1 Tax=Homoserinimonas sp. OAct 916 TaxID=2211450 RepID=UPI0013009892|nr:LuxR C-terminal-related transcriptional regulator [Homoserinimonas sp. OAct 916]